jgi:murein DD-endopeptidase MepM/ murein hydrolase activator NlpD
VVSLLAAAAMAGGMVLGARSDEKRSITPPVAVVGGVIGPGTAYELSRGPFFPVQGRFYYGEEAARFGASRGGRRHEGQDVFARIGRPLIAVRDGVVLRSVRAESRYAGGRGNFIAIYSAVDDRTYLYFHMARPSPLRRGELVGGGQRIGALGCSGSCDGAHLHFEIRIGRGMGKRPIDPLPIVKRWDSRDPVARKTSYGRL